MKLKIVHETVYEFNEEVFIEPHYLRFKPGVTLNNKLESADFTLWDQKIPYTNFMAGWRLSYLELAG